MTNLNPKKLPAKVIICYGGGVFLFRLEFIDKMTNELFKEMTFSSPKQMQKLLNDLALREGAILTFFDKELRVLKIKFVHLISFITEKDMGFKLFFKVLHVETN